MARGWQVATFAAVESESPGGTAGVDQFLAWRNVPGISARARSGAMRASTTVASDLRKTATELASLLSVEPLSSSDWLALAGTRLGMRAPWDRVTSALTMSYLAGPNEAGPVLRRGLFGLLEWNDLSSTMQAQTIRDLGSALKTADDLALFLIGKAIATKSPTTKAEIAALLLGEQVAAKEIYRIGL